METKKWTSEVVHGWILKEARSKGIAWPQTWGHTKEWVMDNLARRYPWHLDNGRLKRSVKLVKATVKVGGWDGN